MRRINAKSIIRIMCVILVCLSAYLFALGTSQAKEFTSEYKQVIYNQDNGLGSMEVNCIYQTQSGYLWIGTDGGLYRYNGNEFKLFNLWNADKGDVYYINALYQDSMGRLWVATNNYGLFRIQGSETKHFTDEYYNGLKSINDICEDANGNIYVATAYGVYTYNPAKDSLERNEALKKHNVKNIVLSGEKIWGIYNGNTIFNIDKDGKVDSRPSSDYTNDELSTISCDDKGNVFIGTIGTEIVLLRGFSSSTILNSGLEGINKILPYGDKVYICADNGTGYLNRDGLFIPINDLDIDSYVSDMIIDYEGNYWFASSRYGVLYMSKGKFSNYCKDNLFPIEVTSCIDVMDGYTYIGTDTGLYIINQDNVMVSNELTEYLSNVSIRDITHDKTGNIWISTYRRYGVVEYTKSGGIKAYNKSSGLVSNLVNTAYPLKNGSVAVGTKDGISVFSHSGSVIKQYSYENGLDYANIISLYEDEDGILYAGSDGGGLYIINGSNVVNYTDEDGLNSNVVSCITGGKDGGVWIGTNNGMSYYDGTFRSISNIDFSNNIYSVLTEDSSDVMYIVGSKGILCTSESDLLGTAPLTERYYSTGDGLDSTITINSRSCAYNGIIYICTEDGVFTFDSQNIEKNTIPPKINVSEIDVDGKKYYFDQNGGELVIPNKAQRVEISFAVLSYSNRENIQVFYQLVGFDSEPQSLTGNEPLQAVYTNLDGGSYSFEVSATNGDNISSENMLSFTLIKEYGFFEKSSVRMALVLSAVVVLLAILAITIHMWNKFRGKNRELLSLVKKHEDVIKDNTAKNDYLANMSNEIKLPLNAMISTANNLLRDGVGDEDSQKDLRDIVYTGNTLLGKVDETILLARLESGAEEVIKEPYSITTLMCDISDGMINKLEEKPVKFLVDLGESIPDILVGDFDKIKNVLEILLDNSIKYTKEGSITLSVDYYDYAETNSKEDESKKLVFTISDTGIGISEERLEHIFEIYYVDESKKTNSSTGNGISLSIAKRLSEIMDGELEVESTYGAGTTFTFSLKQGTVSADGGSIPLNDNTMERVSREEAERMWAPNLSVLVVDDVEISRNVAADVVAKMEIKCDTASNGSSAIDMVMSNDYDLVLMDIAMPVMNGIDTLKEIRSLSGEQYESLPVIAMSEDVIGKNKKELIDEGFAEVILKPFDITVLASIVTKFADAEKIKYRTNDISEYITESRYSEGLKQLEDYFDIVGTLDKIGGNINVYNRILSSFYNQNKDIVEELKDKLENDYRGFRLKIHSVRNGCQNIGALEVAEIVLRVENAINLGNRGYVMENISMVYDCLTVINDTIADYLAFIEENDGISDEDYAKKYSQTSENEQELPIINISKLEKMQDAIMVEDFESVKKIYDDIASHKYGAEDADFIKVLGESVEAEEYEEIGELLNTYIDLKS